MTIVVRDWTLTRIHKGEEYTTTLHSATRDEVWRYALACRKQTGDVYTYAVKV